MMNWLGAITIVIGFVMIVAGFRNKHRDVVKEIITDSNPTKPIFEVKPGQTPIPIEEYPKPGRLPRNRVS